MTHPKSLFLFLLLQSFLLAQLPFVHLSYDTTDIAIGYAEKYGLDTKQVKNYMIKAKVYVSGWSKKGKFAYAVQLPNEAKDRETGLFIIQDMVTDKILEKITWEFLPDTSTSVEPFETYMKPPTKKISRLLKKHLIISSNMTLTHFPIGGSSSPNTIDAKLYMTWANQPEMFSEETKLLTELSLKLLKTKEYTIVNRKVLYMQKNMLEYRYLDAFIDGYIRSPFERRVAVLLVQVQRGWEGYLYVFKVKFVGASLSKGF